MRYFKLTFANWRHLKAFPAFPKDKCSKTVRQSLTVEMICEELSSVFSLLKVILQTLVLFL